MAIAMLGDVSADAGGNVSFGGDGAGVSVNVADVASASGSGGQQAVDVGKNMAAGAASGAATGAAVGTVVPVVGNVVGAAVGAVIGAGMAALGMSGGSSKSCNGDKAFCDCFLGPSRPGEDDVISGVTRKFVRCSAAVSQPNGGKPLPPPPAPPLPPALQHPKPPPSWRTLIGAGLQVPDVEATNLAAMRRLIGAGLMNVPAPVTRTSAAAKVTPAVAVGGAALLAGLAWWAFKRGVLG